MSTYLSPNHPDLGAEEMCTTIDCGYAAALDQLFLLLWIGLLGVAAIATLLYLPRAREACEEERTRTRAEANAFERFARRVADVDVAPTQAHHAGIGSVPLTRSGDARSRAGADGNLQAVREAYRETVMDVPHYEEEYGESMQTNMAAEFDPDLAAAVCEGSGFTPQLQQTLIEHSKRARDRRETFLEALETESEALTEARDELTDIDDELARMNEQPLSARSFDELADAWERLGRLHDRCQRLIEGRQATLRKREVVGQRSLSPGELCPYVYQTQPVTHPILAEGVRVAEVITSARRRVLDALTRRA